MLLEDGAALLEEYELVVVGIELLNDEDELEEGRDGSLLGDDEYVLLEVGTAPLESDDELVVVAGEDGSLLDVDDEYVLLEVGAALLAGDDVLEGDDELVVVGYELLELCDTVEEEDGSAGEALDELEATEDDDVADEEIEELDVLTPDVVPFL